MEKPIATLLRKLTVRVEKLEKLNGIKNIIQSVDEPKEEEVASKKKKKKR